MTVGRSWDVYVLGSARTSVAMSTKNRERGYAMVLGIVLILTLVSLSTAIVYSAATQHLSSMQDTDRARSLALAEGATSLLLIEISDDPVGPVKNVVSYELVESTYTREYQPFDAGDGTARIELTYMVANGDPLVFADRADPSESYDRLRVVVTGVPAERTLHRARVRAAVRPLPGRGSQRRDPDRR